MTTTDQLSWKGFRGRRGNRKPSRWSLSVRLLMWMLGVPLLLLVVFYARLLAGPLDVSYFRGPVEQAVRAGLPPNSDLEIGKLTLSLDQGLAPVLRFSPVTLTDKQAGASIRARALDIGFSPVFALIGQPSAVVTLDAPKLQVVQDLLGPRLAQFDVREEKGTGETVASVLSGRAGAPSVGILADGVTLHKQGSSSTLSTLRSDNDWLVYNIDAIERALHDLLGQARSGRFSRFSLREGHIEMLDPVYGLVRRLEDVSFSVTPKSGGGETRGRFSAKIGNYETRGVFSRKLDEGGSPVLSVSVSNLDFATLMPFLDDPGSKIAVRGAGQLDGQFHFAGPGGAVTTGTLDVDLSGTKLRMRRRLFPIERARMRLEWAPSTATFTLNEAPIAIAKSSALVKGSFVMGVDKRFGPTVSMSIKARDVAITPLDMKPPATPFTELQMQAWSAPLYGAMGIDRLVVRKPGVEVRAKGRIDMVRDGVGLKLVVGGEGASAEDLKRLWPFFVADKGREWFVSHIARGQVKSATARFDFPVGSLPLDDSEIVPWTKDSVRIDLIGDNVELSGVEQFPAVRSQGEVQFSMRDGALNVRAQKGVVGTDPGEAQLAGVNFAMDLTDPKNTKLDIAGELSGDLPVVAKRLVAALGEGTAALKLPVAPEKLKGQIAAKLTASLKLDAAGEVRSMDYRATGSVAGFSAQTPIDGHELSKGDFNFSAQPDQYQIIGKVGVDGALIDLGIKGKPDGSSPLVTSTLDSEALKKLGYDLSEFITGPIQVEAAPKTDGSLDVQIDIKQARLEVRDLGLNKAAGIAGNLKARILQDGTHVRLSDVSIGFAGVRLAGEMLFDTEKGLLSADFSDFALSEGDKAQLSVKPRGKGFAVTVRGDQLDLKPMLERYFALNKVSTGGPQSTAIRQEIMVDAELKRALGYYSTTAYNLDLKLDLAGEDLRSVSLQAQFGQGNSVSITTNSVSNGRVMTAAAKDAGTLLRFLNVYPRLLGGTGSLVMHTDPKTRVDRGEIRLRDFSIADEKNVAEVLGNHKDSRALIAQQNRVNFKDARGKFVRRSDRIEVKEAVVDGGDIGGTLRGFIYTKKRQYDLNGTYVPLFALNNVFQKIPIFGPLLGGRDGEGLIGVTFAIRGNLDNPNFLVNPASLLLPGVFRTLTEFRAKEAPREKAPAPSGQ